MDRSGKCMCGAVRFTIRDLDPEFGTCHCKMCQRWTGSAYMALTVPADAIRIEGGENIKRYQSSDWAERAWCGTCGSNLWYRVTIEGPEQGVYHMPIGLLDDTTGLTMTREIFVDEKSGAFELAGERQQMTGAEVFAMYAPEGKQ